MLVQERGNQFGRHVRSIQPSKCFVMFVEFLIVYIIVSSFIVIVHAVLMRQFESDFGMETPCGPTSGGHRSTSGDDAFNTKTNVIDKDNVPINHATSVITFNSEPITEPTEERLLQFNTNLTPL